MPVQVYTSSPINASKASGVTPKTASPEDAEFRAEAPAEAPATVTSPAGPQTYLPAQPGARPSIPIQTGAPQSFTSSIQPTPTTTQTGSGPPAPQPGAIPVPPTGGSHVPPPPKAGESKQQPPQITSMPMPPQMSYPPPSTTYPARGGTSTAATTAAAFSQYPTGPKPTFLQGDDTRVDYSHPPGYQQNVHAADFTSHQRAAHNASLAQSGYHESEEEGVWSAAKKWATAAGDSLAAAENEIWKRINKD